MSTEGVESAAAAKRRADEGDEKEEPPAKRGKKADPPECPVCFNFMFDPHMNSGCGHSVCNTCSRRLDDKCPTCRKSGSFVPNFAMADILRAVYPEEVTKAEALNDPDKLIKVLSKKLKRHITVERNECKTETVIKLLRVVETWVENENWTMRECIVQAMGSVPKTDDWTLFTATGGTRQYAYVTSLSTKRICVKVDNVRFIFMLFSGESWE